MSALPKHVYDKKGVLYFQRRGWPTQRLHALPGTPEIAAEVDKILATPLPPPSPRANVFEMPDGTCHFRGMEVSAKKRAASKGRANDLPDGWAKEQFARQGGRCAMTGVAFVKSRFKHAPLAPSIDRIDSTLGYTPDNCRLVTYIVNCAKNQFTEAEFYAMCLAAIKHKAGL